jgi:phosphatidate phosphatase PAH1
MSPDGFIRSFQREVIDKTPDFLKTKMLATVNEMFPQSRKPLYCGFGNR